MDWLWGVLYKNIYTNTYLYEYTYANYVYLQKKCSEYYMY